MIIALRLAATRAATGPESFAAGAVPTAQGGEELPTMR
jgi:hypothetical protein